MGAKSRNIANLRGKLPSWIHLPTSAALPFGVFEKVLAESINKVNNHIYALESLVSLYKPMAIYLYDLGDILFRLTIRAVCSLFSLAHLVTGCSL